jgi:hypothetical protein
MPREQTALFRAYRPRRLCGWTFMSVAFVAAPLTARAADCGMIGGWLGLCEAAAAAGRDAAIAAGRSVENAADTAFSAVNYWPWLIQKYHTGTEAEKKQARELISKVFGVDAIADAQPFQVTFYVEGVDTTQSPLDLIVLRDYTTPNLATKIGNGNTSDFNAMPIVGSAPPAQESYETYIADVSAIRARLFNTFNAVDSSPLNWGGFLVGCSMNSPGQAVCQSLEDGQTYSVCHVRPVACDSNVEWAKARRSLDSMVDAIMFTVDPKVEKRANRPSVSIAYEGYNYLTLVFPEEQLRLQPKLSISFNVHLKGKPDDSIPIFEGNRWEISQASLIASNNVYESSRREHSGRYIAYLVDLGLK